MSATSIRSLVEYFGAQEDRHCGYCKSESPNRFTYGMWSHEMTVQVYQDILDRGWRRSGKYCYKPDMKRICCPQYTIRCDALQFHASRSQKRVIQRMNTFLSKGELPKRATFDVDVDHPPATESETKQGSAKNNTMKLVKNDDCRNAEEAEKSAVVNSEAAAAESKGTSDDNRRQLKAKYRRRQRKLEKLRARGIEIDRLPPRPPPNPKPIEGRLSFSPSSSTDCLKVEGASHKLEIRLVRSCPASEEFKRTYAQSEQLYMLYQLIIHKDESSASTYKRFLVDSPLQPIAGETKFGDDHPGYGSFHQQYWLDGEKLIAVGVLDILPNCMSAKYFYYDPEYRSLSLGVYSALQEVALVRRLQSLAPSLRYYYMGYYIHSCPKMRYKGRYRPSDLLCPETYIWHPVGPCQAKLDVAKYSRFGESGLVDTASADISIQNIPVLYKGRLMRYDVYKTRKYGRNSCNINETDENEVKQLASLLGSKAAPFVILYRSDED